MPANRTCSVLECASPVRVKGLCALHYHRNWRLGSLELPPKPVRAVICAVDGCGKPRGTSLVCDMHQTRKQRTGTYDARVAAPPIQRPHSAGYRMIQDQGHLLADKNGSVFVHRLVLFESIGFGPHRCHWCETHINWRAGLECDHVDRDRANNDLANLVPSCHGCNTRRARWRNQYSPA